METALDFGNPDEGILKIIKSLAPIGAPVSEQDIVERFKAEAGEEMVPNLYRLLKWMADEGIVEWSRQVSVKILAQPAQMSEAFFDDTEGK